MIFKGKKTVPLVEVTDAREKLKEGMMYYLGGVPQWAKAYDAVAEWLSCNGRKGLLAVGSKGRGKSLVCRDVIPEILREEGLECLCVSSYEMSRDVKALFSAKVLVIDDVGTEDVASFYGERHDLFKEVVDHAERNAVLLILTTNLTSDELMERYGERIIDRLYSIVKPVVFKGESLRGKKIVQPSYAYGVRFDTLKEADAFAEEQERIRDGIEEGRIKLFDDWAQEAYELNEALTLVGDVAYKYGVKS